MLATLLHVIKIFVRINIGTWILSISKWSLSCLTLLKRIMKWSGSLKIVVIRSWYCSLGLQLPTQFDVMLSFLLYFSIKAFLTLSNSFIWRMAPKSIEFCCVVWPHSWQRRFSTTTNSVNWKKRRLCPSVTKAVSSMSRICARSSAASCCVSGSIFNSPKDWRILYKDY